MQRRGDALHGRRAVEGSAGGRIASGVGFQGVDAGHRLGGEALLNLEDVAGIAAGVGGAVGRAEAQLRPHLIEGRFDGNGRLGTAVGADGAAALHEYGDFGAVAARGATVAESAERADLEPGAVAGVVGADERGVVRRLLGGDGGASVTGGGGDVDVAAAGAGGGREASDRLVDIDVHVRLVDNFPAIVSMR